MWLPVSDVEMQIRLLRVAMAEPAELARLDDVLAGSMAVGVGIQKIVSGGHSGAERAALDWAIKYGVPHGGWCARGRKTLDGGKVPPMYALKPVRGKEIWEYIPKNIRDSDATVIFTLKAKIPQGIWDGSMKTAWIFARAYGKPCLHLSKLVVGATGGRALAEFVREHNVKVLNVVGERACRWVYIDRFVLETLAALRKSEVL